jgi:hypothetical protein
MTKQVAFKIKKGRHYSSDPLHKQYSELLFAQSTVEGPSSAEDTPKPSLLM